MEEKINFEIINDLEEIKRRRNKICISCIPGYKEIIGNKKANQLAKIASSSKKKIGICLNKVVLKIIKN